MFFKESCPEEDVFEISEETYITLFQNIKPSNTAISQWSTLRSDAHIDSANRV
jgi:hypothetical protein